MSLQGLSNPIFFRLDKFGKSSIFAQSIYIGYITMFE